MKLFAFLLLLNLAICIKAFQIKPLDIFRSSKDIAVGIGKDLGNLIPTPEAVFDAGKQVIAAYPTEVVSTAINKICSAALSKIQSPYTPDINLMNFQLRTACGNYSFPLLEADKMWHSPHFNARKKVVIFATGWTTDVNTLTIDVLAKAYHCRDDVNFVAVDAAQYVNTLYTWSAFNTEEIGSHIAEGLVQLSNVVPVENIHLIGHSLGAHIVGAAARYFSQRTNKLIPRVTGLDPAKPCFNEGEELSGLLRGDAKFIDVVHSNPGVLGKRNPIGDVDFYPGGLDPLPKGCGSPFCAHARAWEYYAESVYPGNENNFMGIRCTSLTRLRKGRCTGPSTPMGYNAPHDVKGNYFLEINAEEPFGKNSKTARVNHEKCGLCNVK